MMIMTDNDDGDYDGGDDGGGDNDGNYEEDEDEDEEEDYDDEAWQNFLTTMMKMIMMMSLFFCRRSGL